LKTFEVNPGGDCRRARLTFEGTPVGAVADNIQVRLGKVVRDRGKGGDELGNSLAFVQAGDRGYCRPRKRDCVGREQALAYAAQRSVLNND